MCFRVPFAAAALLAVAAGPVLARDPSSASSSSPAKPAGPSKVAGKTLEQWVKEITNHDPGRREAAIRTVPYFGKAAVEAAPALRAVLDNDTDVSCKVNAALTLSGLASDLEGDAAGDAVRALARQADAGQLIVRLHAVWALGAFGPKAAPAIPILIKRIHDTNSWELRQAALASLASAGQDVNKAGPDPQAVAAVAGLLFSGEEKSGQVRLAAVRALRTLGRPLGNKEFGLAADALQKAAGDKEHDKTVAVWALAGLMALDKDKMTEDRLSELARYLKGKDVMVKVNAALALGGLGEPARPRIPEIIDLLDDQDPLVVATAIDVLGGFGKAAEKAVEPLRKAMTRKDHAEYFIQAAAAALKNITGKEEKLPPAEKGPGAGSVPPRREDPKDIGGKPLDEWLKEIKTNTDPSVQETALRIVPFFGKKAGSAAPVLVYRLQSSANRDIACRAHAILALAAIADNVSDSDASKVVDALRDTLNNETQTILRFHAANALGAYSAKASSAIPALINALHAGNSWELRQASVASLSTIAGGGKVGPDPRAVVAIANRLLSDDPERSGAVRAMLVMTLGAFGRPAGQAEFLLASRALVRAQATDTDKSVQIWAEVALMAVENKVSDKGLDDVAHHITKGKDVAAKLTAARALGAMGKEARPKIADVAGMLADDDPAVMSVALDVLAGFGSNAHEAVPAIQRFIDRMDKHTTLTKEQRDYFKEAAKWAIEQIEGPPKK